MRGVPCLRGDAVRGSVHLGRWHSQPGTAGSWQRHQPLDPEASERAAGGDPSGIDRVWSLAHGVGDDFGAAVHVRGWHIRSAGAQRQEELVLSSGGGVAEGVEDGEGGMWGVAYRSSCGGDGGQFDCEQLLVREAVHLGGR